MGERRKNRYCKNLDQVSLHESLRVFTMLSLVTNRYKDSTDVKVMSVVGDILPAAVRGEANLLDTLMEDNLLSQFYMGTFGIDVYLQEMARIVGQISNRYPHVNILEIGKYSLISTVPFDPDPFCQAPVSVRRPKLSFERWMQPLLPTPTQTSWTLSSKPLGRNSRDTRTEWHSEF